MNATISAIVEGHGDVIALPLLIRRLKPLLHVPRPIRLPRSRIVVDEHLERYLQIAKSNIADASGTGGILIMFDADDDCPVEIAQQRAAFAKRVTNLPSVCVVPNREFEAWLLAGDRSHSYEQDPETVRDPKSVIRHWYGRYSETADQPRLSARADLDAVRRRCRSFRRLESALEQLGATAG